MIEGPAIVHALPCHIELVASHAREMDVKELWAAACMTPSETLWRAYKESRACWTGLYDSIPVCMFGVTPGDEMAGVGIPWMVGTEHIDNIAYIFLKHCKPVVGEMLKIYPRLLNYVDDRNRPAKMWLKWLGFKLETPQPFGPFGIPFRRFTMGF